MRRKNKYILCFTAFLTVVNGCGLFETRDPEDPETIRSTFFPPTSAQIVIDNLSFSIQEKNSENYFKSLSPVSYKYAPDSRSQQLYEQIFAGWSQQSEKRYLDNLILETDANSTSILFPSNQRLTQITSDSAVYQTDYTIVFQHRRISVPKSAKGNLTFSIATEGDGLFYIKKWEDFRQNDTDFTWSELKANFSN